MNKTTAANNEKQVKKTILNLYVIFMVDTQQASTEQKVTMCRLKNNKVQGTSLKMKCLGSSKLLWKG